MDLRIVYIDDIRLFNKRSSSLSDALLAVEMNNKNVTRIRLRYNISIYSYVAEYVEPGSTIHLKLSRYYSTIPDGYTLVRVPQAFQHRRHPEIVHIYKDLKKSGLYGSTQRYVFYENINYCLSECSYKYNRIDKTDGELFYEILYNAVHMKT